MLDIVDENYAASAVYWDRVDYFLREILLVRFDIVLNLVKSFNFVIKHGVFLAGLNDHSDAILVVNIFDSVYIAEAALSEQLIDLVLILKERSFELFYFWHLVFIGVHV